MWQFDDEVAENFDDMLERSIPQYQEMRRLVTVLADRRLPTGGTIVDLGCSLGAGLEPFKDRAQLIGIDNSRPMVERARRRLPQAAIIHLDLERHYPAIQADVTLAVLTLQFLSMKARKRVMQQAANHSSFFIVVEKTMSPLPEFEIEYHDMKFRNGYTREEIEKKRQELEGVLRPLAAWQTENLLAQAGWRPHRFWQWMNFAAWVADRK